MIPDSRLRFEWRSYRLNIPTPLISSLVISTCRSFLKDSQRGFLFSYSLMLVVIHDMCLEGEWTSLMLSNMYSCTPWAFGLRDWEEAKIIIENYLELYIEEWSRDAESGLIKINNLKEPMACVLMHLDDTGAARHISQKIELGGALSTRDNICRTEQKKKK